MHFLNSYPIQNDSSGSRKKQVVGYIKIRLIGRSDYFCDSGYMQIKIVMYNIFFWLESLFFCELGAHAEF